ncbi:Hypothetical predicted protein [Paramuricea clavata]|uniref:Uncharacterized protein n=1 Tax=Paramuricea clavata TaxID=317549 RepID=A0A7D9E4K0_PARCT|nr:Hypothetical predicted protein [Paramuricea clavata]
MSRTAMWLEFADDKDDYLLPPPYNVLHIPISYFRKKWKERKVDPERKKDPEKIEMNDIDNDDGNKKLKNLDRKRIILQDIALRYLEKKTKESEEALEHSNMAAG